MPETTNSTVPIFSSFENKIDCLFESDKIFQDLFKDYVLCVCNVLEMKKDLNKYSADIEEYGHLQRYLEQDILQMITGKNSPGI